MKTTEQLYQTVMVHKPNADETKKIIAIYEICERIFKDCQIDKRHEPIYHMLIWNIQRFMRLHRNDWHVKFIEILDDLERNLLNTEIAIKKQEISADRFISYLGGMTQGICLMTRPKRKK